MKFKVLQIYKFCQCKNGTHKIYSNNAVSVQSVQNLQDNSYSFKVDCNRKRFFSSASKADDVEDNTAATTSSRMPSTRKPLNPDQDTATKDGKANENSVENNNSNSNIWSIFGMNSFAPRLEQLTHVKLFILLTVNYLALFHYFQ